MKRLAVFLILGAATTADAQSISGQYGETAQKLIAAALEDTEGLARLQYLCDRIGNRLSGSASLERAIEWSSAEMKKAGLSNVRMQPVKVPHWVRGVESAAMVAPIEKPLTMIGLGMSVGTPPDGITGEVLPVENSNLLAALSREKVAGKIVLFTAANDDKTYRTPGYRQAVTVDLPARELWARSRC